MDGILQYSDSIDVKNDMQSYIYQLQANAVIDLLKPKIGQDGNQWFVGYKEIYEVDSIYGWGDTLNSAVMDFWTKYHNQKAKPLKLKNNGE